MSPNDTETGERALPLSAGTAKPLYLNNDDVRSVAADVRRQLQSAADGCWMTAGRLLQIETIRANDAALDVVWSTDYPVTNERGEPVLGVCEYDHRGDAGYGAHLGQPRVDRRQ